MSGDYISREKALKLILTASLRPEKLTVVQAVADAVAEYIQAIPAADVVEVVRCRDCKHRIVNEHYGEKGYLKLKAMCELDTGDPFEFARDAGNEDWFCADGERKDGGQEDA